MCVTSVDINHRSEIGLTKFVEHIVRVKRQQQNKTKPITLNPKHEQTFIDSCRFVSGY